MQNIAKKKHCEFGDYEFLSFTVGVKMYLFLIFSGHINCLTTWKATVCEKLNLRLPAL